MAPAAGHGPPLEGPVAAVPGVQDDVGLSVTDQRQQLLPTLQIEGDPLLILDLRLDHKMDQPPEGPVHPGQ